MLSLGATSYCCNYRSVAVLVILPLVGACFCCLLSFTYCLGAAAAAVLASAVYYYRLFSVLVLSSTAAVAVYLLSWRLLGVRFCCCRSFTVLVMLYRVNLVLSAAAASI
ncbi:hypothetical protein MAM1_0238d08552 [Mucor ambiguus]|uniref:Uncharacterized protein n=1 Tax=Mucor ambiguus TaxID=91626 RepID=A0A0C9LWS4_9FUNG|nr:hypothetical protein MAM1_0238d08552 [Mucor ambiguus]